VQRDLEASGDLFLRSAVGVKLRSVARRPQNGPRLPDSVMNLDDHPLLLPAIDFGERLTAGAPPQQQLAASAIVPLQRFAPKYPPLAWQARITGVVKLNAIIAVDGSVKKIEVISGHPLLVPAALDAFKDWKFPPQSRDTSGVFDIPFTLPAGDPPELALETPRKMVAPARIKVGPNVFAARLIRKVDPVYPAQARAENIQGDVTVQILVDTAGHVTEVTPIEGNPVLAAAAVDAVRQYAYQPTLLNGNPVEVTTNVVVPFRLP
jgi:TonB family protein